MRSLERTIATKGYLRINFRIDRNSSSTLCAQTSLIVYEGIGSSGMITLFLNNSNNKSLDQIGKKYEKINLLKFHNHHRRERTNEG